MTNCSVKGCTTTTRHCSKTKNGITLHGFPADPIRNEIWIRIMRKQRGDPCYKYNKYAKVCSLHFVADSFYTTKKGRIKLKDTALPCLKLKEAAECDLKKSTKEAKSDIEQSLHETKSDLKQSSHEAKPDIKQFSHEVRSDLKQSPQVSNIEPHPNEDILDVDISDLQQAFDSPHEVKLKMQIAKYEERHIKNIKTLKYLRTEIHRLKKRNLSLHGIVKDLQKKYLINNNMRTSQVTPELAEIYKMDVKCRRVKEKNPMKKARLQFSPALQKFALTLNSLSPDAYMYVRRTFNCCLPHPRTLHTWYSSINGELGTKPNLTTKPVVHTSETANITDTVGLRDKLKTTIPLSDFLMLTYMGT